MLRPKAVIFALFGTLTVSVSQAFSDRQLIDMAAALGVDASAFTAVWNDTFEERVTGMFPSIQANLEYIVEKLDARADESAFKRAAEVRNAATRHLLGSLRPDASELPSGLRRLLQLAAACGSAVSISSSLPGMPGGKPAGVRCRNLTEDNAGRIAQSSKRSGGRPHRCPGPYSPAMFPPL